jgi:hypothetical protein
MAHSKSPRSIRKLVPDPQLSVTGLLLRAAIVRAAIYTRVPRPVKLRASASGAGGIRHPPGLGDHRNLPGRNQRRQDQPARIEPADEGRPGKEIRLPAGLEVGSLSGNVPRPASSVTSTIMLPVGWERPSTAVPERTSHHAGPRGSSAAIWWPVFAPRASAFARLRPGWGWESVPWARTLKGV